MTNQTTGQTFTQIRQPQYQMRTMREAAIAVADQATSLLAEYTEADRISPVDMIMITLQLAQVYATLAQADAITKLTDVTKLASR